MGFWSRLFGRTPAEVDKAATPLLEAPTTFRPTEALGVAGTAIYGGYIATRETNSALSNSARYRTYADLIANVAIVAASIRYYLNLICRPSWRWEAPQIDTLTVPLRERQSLRKAQSDAQRIADLVAEIFDDMNRPWRRVVRSSALYRFYGFAVSEWIAKKRADGVIGLLDVAPRPQHTIARWSTDESGTVYAASQRGPLEADERWLPRGKLMHLVDDALTDSPEGFGLLRQLIEPAHRGKRYRQLEGYAYETDLRGVPLIRAPLSKLKENKNLSETQIGAALQPLKNFQDGHVRGPDTGLMIDSRTYEDGSGNPTQHRHYEVELLRGDAAGQVPLAASIVRTDYEIARILGTEILLIGTDGNSLALIREKAASFATLIDGALQEIGEAVRKDLVEPLARLNGWDPALLPKPKIDSLQMRDVEQLAGVVETLARAGATLRPGDPVVNAIRGAANLPDEPEIDLEMDAMLRPGRAAVDPDDPLAREEPEDDEDIDRTGGR